MLTPRTLLTKQIFLIELSSECVSQERPRRRILQRSAFVYPAITGAFEFGLIGNTVGDQSRVRCSRRKWPPADLDAVSLLKLRL